MLIKVLQQGHPKCRQSISLSFYIDINTYTIYEHVSWLAVSNCSAFSLYSLAPSLTQTVNKNQ